MNKPYIKGISILGGEPTDNLDSGELIDLVKELKTIYPKKTIWCWTGYQYEDLIDKPNFNEFIKYVDVLIDGEFDYTKKNLNNAWRNSENQRIINIKDTLEKGELTLYNNETN